jgi:hypothetical protein
MVKAIQSDYQFIIRDKLLSFANNLLDLSFFEDWEVRVASDVV